MRLIGLSERTLAHMCKRAKSRVAFGRPVADQGVTHERIAESRIAIEQCRLLTLKAARTMDTMGNKAARAPIAMIKVAAPNMACRVLDWVIRAFGAAARTTMWASHPPTRLRILRIADVQTTSVRKQIARLELEKYA